MSSDTTHEARSASVLPGFQENRKVERPHDDVRDPCATSAESVTGEPETVGLTGLDAATLAIAQRLLWSFRDKVINHHQWANSTVSPSMMLLLTTEFVDAMAAALQLKGEPIVSTMKANLAIRWGFVESPPA